MTSQSEREGYLPTQRGTLDDDTPAFVVEDGNYVSARWPGDAYLFAKRFGVLVAPPGRAPLNDRSSPTSPLVRRQLG